MKFYHIDRSLKMSEGQIIYALKNVYFEDELNQKNLDLIKDYYNDGLSRHGIHYLLHNDSSSNDAMPLSYVMDIIFEYERLLNYKDKLSRYQAFFAFDNEGIKSFIEQNNLSQTNFKIYEVESDYYEKHNMSLISGDRHYNIAAMAKCYWENKDDPYKRPVVNEYLLKLPVRIIKEVSLDEIK